MVMYITNRYGQSANKCFHYCKFTSTNQTSYNDWINCIGGSSKADYQRKNKANANYTIHFQSLLEIQFYVLRLNLLTIESWSLSKRRFIGGELACRCDIADRLFSLVSLTFHITQFLDSTVKFASLWCLFFARNVTVRSKKDLSCCSSSSCSSCSCSYDLHSARILNFLEIFFMVA